MNRPTLTRKLALVLSLLATLVCLAAVGAVPALAAAPHWKVITRPAPTLLEPGKTADVRTVLINTGDAPVVATAANPVVITETLPEGLVPLASMGGEGSTGTNPNKAPLHCTGLRCTLVAEVPPFIPISVILAVQVEPDFKGGANTVTVEGANVLTPPLVQQLAASSSPTPFGIESYELNAEEEDGSPDLRAGSHPFQLTTTLDFNQSLTQVFGRPEFPSEPELIRNVFTTLPPGLLGDPLVLPTCSMADFSTILLDTTLCPEDTAVGVAVVTFAEPTFAGLQTESVPVFNLEPGEGEPARFGFEFASVEVTLDTGVQTGDGYAVEVKVSNISSAAEVLGTVLTIWGVPGESSHDNARGWACLGGGRWVAALANPPKCLPSAANHPAPYLTLPTTCERELNTEVQAQSWTPGASLLPPVKATEPRLIDCGALPFEPSITVTPDEKTASTPSGMTVDVSLPQESTLSSNEVAEADVRATELVLPEGLVPNAGAALGLETCSVGAAGLVGRLAKEGGAFGSLDPLGGGAQEQLEADKAGGLEEDLTKQTFTSEKASCPDASEIGEVSIKTPLLENELKGAVYLGGQDTNPFASPLVLYIMAEDKKTGVRVKLAGETRISPTGQLTSVFRETPPVPFETLKLHLFNGPRASIATPAYCRSYEAAAAFLPWSGEAETRRSASFAIEAGPNGEECRSSGPLPFSPTLQAGSLNGQAGAFTSFSVTIGHPDGNQPLKQISLQLPEGLAGVLATVPLCPGAQAEKGSCPEASEVGASTAYAGLGPDAVTLPGKVYLTGPVKGAPFGLLDVTEAKAGPFNLGFVPVLSTITVNETTAAVTVTSDPIPQYVKGVPSQIKALNVTVNRANFQFNPTNCTPTKVGGTLTGYEGAASSVSSPFDVANCANLPFAPKLTASVGPKASKLDGASFHVKIESAGIGQANIRKVQLELPEALPSRNTTLQKACLEKVFNENPAGCDEGSVIGSATVHTPVLKNPLSGPAYLVSHGNAAFPDVEFVLQGEGIKLVLDGKTDIKKINGAEVTFSRFETSPDAPFTTFETDFPQGPHSVLTSYVPQDEYNLCAATNLTMPTTIVGQNGAVIEQTTKIVPTGCSGTGAFKQTKAQKLTAALKKCKKLKKKKKRASCESAARKKYSGSAAKKASLRRHAKPASKHRR